MLRGLAAAAASHSLVPFALDHEAMCRSVFVFRFKYDAYGAKWTLERLVSGELLDCPVFSNRYPVLTILAGVGFLVSLLRWRRRLAERSLAVLFVFWLVLYFDRPPVPSRPSGLDEWREISVPRGGCEAQVDARKTCFVMLKATFHPRWRLEVDGTPVGPVMLAPAFVGVEVTAGSQRVLFRYRPGPLRGLLFLAGLGAVLFAAWGVRRGLLRRLEELACRWPRS